MLFLKEKLKDEEWKIGENSYKIGYIVNGGQPWSECLNWIKIDWLFSFDIDKQKDFKVHDLGNNKEISMCFAT